MRLALGIYTEMSMSTPAPAFRRALALIYRPVFSYLYNNPGLKMSLYQSAAMIRHIDSSGCTEVNFLLASLAKRSDLEIITGSYSQTIISLNPPKDRSLQIEKMTTMIRRYYGVRATSCFFYGQIWSPSFIHPLRNSGISSVVISAYRAPQRETIERGSFIMNELGKRMKIHVSSDDAAALVSHYAQGKIGFDELQAGLRAILDEASGDVVFFINIDQLLEGAARDGSDDRIKDLFISILSDYSSSIIPLSAVDASRPGYLDSGWYGRDAWARGLTSFNDIFVRNESFRYMFNRYIVLSDFIASFKKDKATKRDAAADLFHVSLGTLFIHDAQCAPMRQAERRLFWKAIIESEGKIWDSDSAALYREYDFEEVRVNDYIARNKTYIAVFSPKGGGLAELSFRPLAMNLIDTRTPFVKEFPYVSMNKSFSDRFSFSDGSFFDGTDTIYDADIISRTRGEYQFSATLADGKVSVLKHFKLRSQTVIMESVITADEDIEGRYIVPFYLSDTDMELASLDQRRLLMLGLLDDVRTVRYTDQSAGLVISFSSTDSFSLSEERVMQSQYTSIGLESFGLYTRLDISFPLSLKKGEARMYRLIARAADSSSKEKD